MANRTVTVGLRAEVGQYKRGVGEAERATERLADAIDGVDGKGFGQAAAQAKKLDGQIRQTQVGIQALARAFANTGDVKILASIREQQKALVDLRNVRKLLPDSATAGSAGEQLATRISAGFESRARTALPDGIRNALMSASPAKLGAVGLGAALAPTLGTLIAGAVIGGAGLGGIAGGIALAAKSPVVADRAKDLGKMVSSGLQLEASQALTRPLQYAMDDLQRIAERNIPKIGQIFEEIGPSIDRLTQSTGRGLDGLIDGLVDSAKNAGPVLDELGNLVADTGASAGSMMSNLSEHSEAAASGIRDVNTALQDVITVTSGAVELLLTIKEIEDATDEWAAKWSPLLDTFIFKGSKLGDVFSMFKDQLWGPIKPLAELVKVAEGADQRMRLISGSMGAASTAAENLAATENDVKDAQEKAKQAQDDYTRSLTSLNPVAARSRQILDGLKAASDALYGSQIRAAEGNETWEASWDNLSASVKENKRSLDIHTAAGRANRDAIEDLLTKSTEMYAADVAAGMATDEATKKHRKRVEAVKEEASKLGLNKKITGELIDTYGQIPPKKTTDLVTEGVGRVAKELKELSVIQYALAKGIPIASARAAIGGETGPAKRGGGYASGGLFDGRLPGPPSSVDNLQGVGPHGRTFGLAGGEYVVNARSTAKHLPELIAINKDKDGYAAGGYFPAMDRSTRWPFEVTADRTKVMSEAEARSKVVMAFDRHWPSSPSAQRGDSGVWHKVVALIKSTGPVSGSFGNAYRPGDPKWHGSGRAVDWMGYEQDALASFLARQRPLELIHRTKKRDYAYTRGVNKGSFNNALMEAHRNHVHIAMAGGGVINEHVLGVGRSGTTYEFGEHGPERVTPLRGYASGGYVNIAPNTSTTTTTRTGTHLDYVEAYLSARDAVASLSATLKANGRAWSTATAKGRDNRQALISTIRAAQQAAVAKYNETGSVKAANKVYADYLKTLDRTLKAMGLNAKQRRALIKAYGEKPDYNLPEAAAKAPSNSSARVRSITDQMAAEQAAADAKAAFAWTKPTFNTRTVTGRSELQTLFSFLSAAEQAAQSLYAEGGNAKASTNLYNSYLNQLRAFLLKSGMKKAEIDRLFQQYGRITLQRNQAGGLYEHAATGVLRDAHIALGNRTLYAYAEPATGGELFAPRYGNTATTRKNVTKAVTQWWGGRDPWGGGGSSRPITVNATIPITLGSEVITRQVRIEVDAAVGQVVAATVYQTA